MHFKNYLISLGFCVMSRTYALDFELVFQFDRETKKQETTLKKKSELYRATNHTYNSIFAIRHQAEQDAQTLQESLKSQGYLEAKVQVFVQQTEKKHLITFQVVAGNRFKLGRVVYVPPFLDVTRWESQSFSYKLVEEIEKNLIEDLKNSGYFFAEIQETKIVLTNIQKADVHIYYDPKELYYFGAYDIAGLKHVKQSVIESKIPWKDKDVFNASMLQELQKKLLETELFSQVTVKAREKQGHLIPVSIEVVESKFNSVSLGISYQTHFGAGGDLSFENKNVAGKGQRLNLETSVTQNSILGKIDYEFPHYYKDNQSLNIKIEATREELQPSFSDNLYDFTAKFNKEIHDRVSYDLGISGRYYLVQHSVMNGPYGLIMPFFKYKYDNTYSVLDPKEGIKASVGCIYHQNINHPKNFTQVMFKGSFFYSVLRKKMTFAERIYLSSLFSESLDVIPVPLRFFGGTDEYLRGFKYYTVSPLLGNKPIGGKSCLFLNSEIRITIKNPFGLVLFYDSGFVSAKNLFYQDSPYYQSYGIGFRYYAFFGPLRIDVGFPINRRKNLDDKFKILASFGHTF